MVSQTKEYKAQDWVKARSSLDASESNFLTWKGKIYSLVPGEKRKLLFKMLGVSVSRCILQEEGSWDFMSRELTYYLNPETEEILHKWENPFTGEILPVMHVANNPVQGYFKGTFPAEVEGDTTNFVFDIFPHYPNPLAGNPKFTEYSPQETYQAAELFKLSVPTADLFNPELSSVTQLKLSWDRIGQWVPWMKMGNNPGQMIYSGYGGKVRGLEELPQLLQDEITSRLPIYKNAPKSFKEGEDMTSWLYFNQNFDAYLAGERFPLPMTEE